ncbi:hypothetical protein DFH28DRAFT_880292 [Melampsora americana]|nr:hypothetical protein DFH28DRAFT_880292 [Melampsora americana]
MNHYQDCITKKQKGVPVPSFQSKTAPSVVNSHLLHNKEHDLGRLYPCKHAGRTRLKTTLAEKFGVPADSKFIF